MEQKSFWKRYELIILAIATLIFVYLVVFFNQKINFFLGNELIVYLTPQQKSFSMHYGDVGKIEFGTSIDNFAYCKAACSYSFNDRSRNEMIDKGNFGLSIGEHVIKGYNLSVKRLGSGQDIYSFEVRCHSIRSALCLTKGIEKSRSSLVTVNYDLTETEKKLKDSLKQNVTRLLLLLADIDLQQQKLNQKYFELGFKVNLKNLSKDKIKIDDAYDKFVVSVENLRSLWAVENYNKLSHLFNQSFFENLADIEKSINRLDKELDTIVGIHNVFLSELAAINKNLKALENFAVILENEALDDENINSFNAISSNITNNTFDNYSIISSGIEKIRSQQDLLAQDTKLESTKFFFSAEHFLKFDNDFLCSLMQNCKENISISNSIKKAEGFLEDYPDELSLRETCSSLNELNNKYIAAKNETLNLIENKSINFPTDNEFLALADSFKDNEIRKINNSYLDSFETYKNQRFLGPRKSSDMRVSSTCLRERRASSRSTRTRSQLTGFSRELKSENKTNINIIKIAGENLPKNKTDIEQLQYNQSINLSLYLLSKLRLSSQTIENLARCNKLGKEESSIGKFNFEPISTNINYTIIPRIDTNLSDNLPVCCVFSDCKPCCRDDSCRNDPKTFPVIFLHGHSLAKSNSPEFSLDAFNKLQSKLQDDGYLNAGIVSLYSQNEPLQRGIWGLSGRPITVKVSYYFDAFKKEDKYIVVPTKSENIDTYSLRLRDLIGIVMERTNKPKVSIIAHSMGGLVARRYIQIFGEDNVDKLILIATPNKGIAGAVSDYCGFVGENRECQDMQENSLFINKLNDPLKQSTKVKLYSIIGQGCKMKLGDGDGIILTENAKVGNAKLYYINGTCGGLFGENLHKEMLNIDKYPETYRVVKEILQE